MKALGALIVFVVFILATIFLFVDGFIAYGILSLVYLFGVLLMVIGGD